MEGVSMTEVSKLVKLVSGGLSAYEETKDDRHLYVVYGVFITLDTLFSEAIETRIVKILLIPYRDKLTFT